MAKIPVLLVLCFLTAALHAQILDPREIVRRSVEAEIENGKKIRNYTFIERNEERELNDRNQVKSQQSKTYDVTMLDGSSYRRLIERDDQPLAAKEASKEQDKLHRSIEERRNESQSQRERRMAEYEKRPGRDREMLREIPNAFDFKILGEEALNDRPAYIIEGTPHAGYRPVSSEARLVLPKLKLKVWIDKADLTWVRLYAEAIETISWAFCLVRLAPGARFEIEQTHVNNDAWLPLRVRITGSARIALLRKVNMQQEFTFKNFRRFQTDSQIISQEQISR